MIFTPDNLQSRLRHQPFQPMRIVTTTGQLYDIYHPDLVIVGRNFIAVGTPSFENPAHADAVNRIALVHITELRDLPTPVMPSGSELNS